MKKEMWQTQTQNWWTATQKLIPMFLQCYYTEILLLHKFIPDTSRVPPGGRTGWKFFRVEKPVFITQAHTDISS